jgi:hypothetical protein
LKRKAEAMSDTDRQSDRPTERSGARIDDQGFVRYGTLEKLFASLVLAGITSLVGVTIMTWSDNRVINRDIRSHEGQLGQLRNDMTAQNNAATTANLMIQNQIIDLRIGQTRVESELRALTNQQSKPN